MVNVFGRAGAEAIQIAIERRALLWTDDHVLALYAGSDDYGCPRCWTQVACEALSPLFASGEKHSRLALGLLQLKYEFTSINAADALFAAKLARWDVRHRALSRVLDILSKPTTERDGLLAVAAALLKEALTDPVLGLQAQNLTQSIFERLGKRQDGRQLVRTLGGSADAIFGLNVLAAENLKRMARDWLKRDATGNNRIIIP